LLRETLYDQIQGVIDRLIEVGRLPSAARVPFEVAETKNPAHGDFACNFALVAAKRGGANPRQIAESLREELLGIAEVESVDVAGPGFLNLRLHPEAISAYLPRILARGADLARSEAPEPKRINVEFVSVNPNGPITVGSGRGAAFGDALCRVFRAAGFDARREYYINDGVNSEQMRLFAESVKALASGQPLPENGYRGGYVQDVANAIRETHGDVSERPTSWWQTQAQELMIERQRGDLARFGVKMDVWFSEQSLHDEGKVESALRKLEDAGNAYRATKPADAEEAPEEETLSQEETKEALWLRSTAYGDDKDRVLVRADGRPAYIAADVAYMENKLGERGFDKAMIVLGPDHHGYIARMNAVCQALGYPLERFEIVIYQIVRFMKDGKPAPMRKRDGNIYELRDLIAELGASAAPNAMEEEQLTIGRDVARFFFLMRSHETHMDFDIDLATKQSDENPVFYAQYAHARICSVLRKAAEANLTSAGADPSLLRHPRELALIKKILDLPAEVRRCAEDYGVHRLTTYAVELARAYHHFYDACRVVQPDEPGLSRARAALCEAARTGLQATFELLGVSAPERMERGAGSSEQ
jgi:arginyl-tRNA synthetase